MYNVTIHRSLKAPPPSCISYAVLYLSRAYTEQPVSELAESPEVITQKPSFVVFMEGGDKDEQVMENDT